MTLLAFIVGIFVLVLVHEWGHFQVARWCGVRVETFSICFGPELFSFKRGDTTYRIAAIPLGGYVKMAGDQPGAEDSDAPDGYLAQPIRKRAAIVLAGPVMNFIFAFAVAPIIYWVGVPEPVHLDEPAVIGWVTPGGFLDGLPANAQITQVNDETIDTWRTLQTALGLAQGQVTIQYQAGASAETLTVVTPEPGVLLAELLPPMDAQIENVIDQSPAQRAGIQIGDQIVRMSNTPIEHWMQIRNIVQDSGGQPVSTVVLRNGAEVDLEIVPEPSDQAEGQYLIGVARKETSTVRQYGFVDGIEHGVGRVNAMIGMTLDVLGRLVTGQLSVKALGGPVAIAQGAGDAARSGLGAFLTFMVFISIQLAVLNLLPIPVLDGGHLFFMGIEAIIGRRVPDRWLEMLQVIGMVLLIGLMLFVTRNDIMRVWGESIRSLFSGG